MSTRKVPGAIHASAPQRASGVNRYVGAAVSAGVGTGGLVILSILFWLIFYQTLPGLQSIGTSGLAIDSGTSANTVDRVIKVAMIAMSVYVMASQWSLTRQVAKNINPGATAFVILAPLSAAWSIEPSATLLRFVSLATIVLVCFSIAVAGGRRRFQQVAIPPLMLVMLASLVMGLFAPDWVLEVGDDLSKKGAWHGITHSKNQFGMMSSITVILCVNRWLAREGRTYWAIAGTVVAVSCLILSRSNTSLFATLLAVLFMVLVMRVPVIKQRFSTQVTVAIAATLLLYELAIQNIIPGMHTLLAPITSLTGKDTTLSARTVIWEVIKGHIQAAPYLGTGYGAYWLGPFPTSPSYVFIPMMYFYPTEAHNGYLDVVNDLGIVGLICVLAFLFWFIAQALRLMRIDRSQAALYLALLFQQMVMNMSESEWFARTSTFAVLLLATACLSRGLLEAPARTLRTPGR